ncbi:MAG: EAL domain-containing protein [Nevskia sp.]|nr:EAL domain-containing protein [Nevskia sp.]
MTKESDEAPKASVLVVDDTPENIDVLTDLLKDDYKVRAAVDGPTALSLVRKFPPDIVLLDIMMPGMNGYEVFQAIHDDPLTCHIPVIFITSMNEVESEKKGLDMGAADYITKPFSPPLVQARVRNHLALQDRRRALELEVQSRTRELADANAALANEVVLRTKAMERAEYLFNFDALTGLPNRRQFMDRLERLLARAQHDGGKLALVGVSLDRFNVVKTTLGGAVGDQMLAQTGQRLQHSLPAHDLLARTGGEEFAAVVSLATGLTGNAAEDAQELAARLRATLATPFELSSGKAEVRASAAYALFPDDGASAGELMRHMETTLEHVKLAGGNRAERFDRNIDSAAGAAFAIELRVRDALKTRALVPYYQPKVEPISGRVVGAETLVRWPIPGGGMISPGKFIPVAERSGLIDDIDRFMLEETCAQVAEWGKRFDDFRIAVNLSASAFQSDFLVANVRSALQRTGAQARHLELEITEHALITDLTVAISKLQALRDLGVRIALDDFGTGYSSMSYLRRLPLDVIKIDQSFVRDIERDRNAAAIVRALITMARALDLHIVAEGVETQAQLDFIVEHGGNAIVQGWIYCPAVPAAAMEEILAQGVIAVSATPKTDPNHVEDG